MIGFDLCQVSNIRVCMQDNLVPLLKKKTPNTRTFEEIVILLKLFSEPNNDSPLNAEAAKYWNKEGK